MTVLRYGTDSSVSLQFAAEVPLEPMWHAPGSAAGRSSGAVAAALEQPLEYPPLAKTTTPGDRVVVALGSGLPQVAQVTAAIVKALMASGIDPDGITILRNEVDVHRGDGQSPAADSGAGGRADPPALPTIRPTGETWPIWRPRKAASRSS